MKTIFTYKSVQHLLFLSALLCVLGMVFPSQAHAQHEELLDKTWYLYKLEIDGDEYPYYSLDIQSVDEANIKTIVENDLEAMIQVNGCPGRGCDYYIELIEDESKFVLIDKLCLAMEYCVSYRANDIAYLQIENYYSTFFTNFGSIVDYDFETIDTIEYLIFTDVDNDKIYYTAENLSSPDFEALSFSISPNPAQDQLYIRLDDTSTSLNLEIYDIHGRLLHNLKMDELEIQLDVSQYASGMYFIQMTEESGKMQTGRFIKR